MRLEDFYNPHGLSALALTFDTDWASEAVVAALLKTLQSRGLKATIFATSPLPCLNRLPEGTIEVALHPNFAPGSSHGERPDDVYAGLVRAFPKARGLRTHGLYQSSNLLRLAARYGLGYDSSLQLFDHPFLQVFDTFYGICRVPYVWSDASHLLFGRPLTLNALHLERPGLKVLDLHPLLLHLNCESTARYDEVKRRFPRLEAASLAELAPFVNSGDGLGRLFTALLDFIESRELTTYTLSQLAEAFTRTRKPEGDAAPYEFCP